MSKLTDEVLQYLTDDIDTIETTCPQGLLRRLSMRVRELEAALSPTMPDDVKAIWCYLRANGQTDAADMLERQAREAYEADKLIKMMEARIAELEQTQKNWGKTDNARLEQRIAELETACTFWKESQNKLGQGIEKRKHEITRLNAVLDRLKNPEPFIDRSKYTRLGDYVDAELSARVEFARGNDYGE